MTQTQNDNTTIPTGSAMQTQTAQTPEHTGASSSAASTPMTTSTGQDASDDSNGGAKTENNAMIQALRQTIELAEQQLKKAKSILHHISPQDMPETAIKKPEAKSHDSVAGVFDGFHMIGEDKKKYPVPLNYASKTKLIPGDQLKLTIMTDGGLIYKVLKLAERKHMKAVLSKNHEGKYVAMTSDGHTYFLNQAAVTFYKWFSGDDLFIIVNADDSGTFAAIEAIIKNS